MLSPQVSNDYWSSVIIAAAGDNETFDDVKIVTLRSHWSDMIYDQVYNELGRMDDTEKTHSCAVGIAAAIPLTQMYEQVSISADGITVVLDVDVVDDDAIFKSMWALSQAVDRLDGCYGTVKLGAGRVMSETDLISF